MRKINLSINNALLSFLLRGAAALIISTIFWVLGIFFYYENNAIEQIDALILKERDDFRLKLSHLNLSDEEFKKNIYKSARESIERLNASGVKVVKNNEVVIDFVKADVPLHVKSKFNHNLIIDHNLKNGIFVPNSAGDEVYIITKVSDDKVDIKVLNKLDKKMKQLMEDDIDESIIVAIGSILFSNLLVFPIFYRQYKTVLENEKNLLQSNISTLNALGNAVSKRDSDTDEHNYRVTFYSVKLAEKIGLNKALITELVKGAFLHDVGKIGIQDSILLKPGKLSTEEFMIMKTHVIHGIEIVEGNKWLEGAKNVIEFHHEKVDGSGYPRGLKGDDIPVEARVFAVVDVFDALTSKRPYKEAFSIQKSIEILTDGVDSHFDPHIVNSFITICSDLYDEVVDKNKGELEKRLYQLISPYFNT